MNIMPLETCTSQQLVTAPVRKTNVIDTCVEGDKNSVCKLRA